MDFRPGLDHFSERGGWRRLRAEIAYFWRAWRHAPKYKPTPPRNEAELEHMRWQEDYNDRPMTMDEQRAHIARQLHCSPNDLIFDLSIMNYTLRRK